MTQPNKYYYKFDQNELVDIDGVLVTANALLPQITLGQKPTINVQLVNDDMTPFTGLASGTVAQLMVDTDFKNDAVPVPLGASGWTNSTGSEYRKYLAYGPESVLFGGTAGTEGTIGTLTAGSWAYDTATDRLYVRLPDSGDPGSKADNYVTAEFDASDATPPYIECYSNSFNTTGSWYTTSGTFATPDVTQGQLAFSLNANTVNYYQRIGTQERAQGNAQMQFYFGGENIANRKMTMILWNRITGSGESAAVLELDGIGYYTKAEADSRFFNTNTIRTDGEDAATDLLVNSSLLSAKYREAMARPNLIVNGSGQIDQQGLGVITITASRFVSDNYYIRTSQSGKVSAGQMANVGAVYPPTGFSRMFTVQSNDNYAPVTGDYIEGRFAVEGKDMACLKWGTSDALPLKFLVWIHDTEAGTYSGAIKNSAFDYSYPFEYTCTVGEKNSWVLRPFTIPGCESGTWLTGAGEVGAYINFAIGVGSTYLGTANTWANTLYLGTTGSTQVTAVLNQLKFVAGLDLYLDEDNVNREFQHKSYGEELIECQRFLRPIPTVSGFKGVSTTICQGAVGIQPPMAKVPTGVILNSAAEITDETIANYTQSAAAGSLVSVSASGVRLQLPNFTGLTTSAHYNIVSINGFFDGRL